MIVHLDLAGQPLKTFTTERLTVKAGERVGVSASPESICLFDVDTGARLHAAAWDRCAAGSG